MTDAEAAYIKHVYADLNVDADYIVDFLFYKQKINVKLGDIIAMSG